MQDRLILVVHPLEMSILPYQQLQTLKAIIVRDVSEDAVELVAIVDPVLPVGHVPGKGNMRELLRNKISVANGK